MSDQNEIISELQDEIHELDTSLNLIQKEKFELEIKFKIMSTENEELRQKVRELESIHLLHTEKIVELENDLVKARAVLMMNSKEFDHSSSQTELSELAQIQDLIKKKRPAVVIPKEQLKESPFNVDMSPKSAPLEKRDLIYTEESKSAPVARVDLLDIITLLREENTILKQKMQLTQDLKYVKNRRTSLLQGGQITL